ncbi:MAG TPA: malto-oligosyltrehalose trehalohydrolase [Terriglobales bacterium]|nr:malto-oligosyltrehalose trehalohydrolase [Terriglobales bacterium]
MKRKHEMPFGADCRNDGSVRFRLWAPGAAQVALDLNHRSFTMPRSEEGWFEFTTEAKSGDQYRFKINCRHVVPDPASRYQPEGVHGASEVIDPRAFNWQDSNWNGRPWSEAVIYELHLGTFTPEGTFSGAEKKLDYLRELGTTAVELMPLSSFPGQRNWGYDGVLPYAPASPYGRPEDLKHFIDAAHAKNLMVFLDVVYNHFGPEGNYLSLYAPQFFTDRHRTPWGQAINFDGPCSRTVRDFFIHNALYWLEEYHFDGLRFDAVHAIVDDSSPNILRELAETVRNKFSPERHIHLVLENENNAAQYFLRDRPARPRWYSAQWDDDIHHALHVLISGETDGYYADYALRPAWHLGRCLAEGFSYQGDPSLLRNGAKRGEISRNLPPDCFVSFLQNHDQIGNRAFGERIVELANRNLHNAYVVRVAMSILLLAPSPPLLFMGEEFAAATPFLFFCDFGPELAAKVTEGRRTEFARFEQFNSPEAQSQIPDPSNEKTFLASKLDWASISQPSHREWLDFYKRVLTFRREKIIPLIQEIAPGEATFEVLSPSTLTVQWPFSNGGGLQLAANFGTDFVELSREPGGELLCTTNQDFDPNRKEIPALTAAWFLNA